MSPLTPQHNRTTGVLLVGILMSVYLVLDNPFQRLQVDLDLPGLNNHIRQLEEPGTVTGRRNPTRSQQPQL